MVASPCSALDAASASFASGAASEGELAASVVLLLAAGAPIRPPMARRAPGRGRAPPIRRPRLQRGQLKLNHIENINLT